MLRISVLILFILSAIMALFDIAHLTYFLRALDRTSVGGVPLKELPVVVVQQVIPRLMWLGFFISLAATMYIIFSRLSLTKERNDAAPKTFLLLTSTFAVGTGLSVAYFAYRYSAPPTFSIDYVADALSYLVRGLTSFALAFALFVLGTSRTNSIKNVLVLISALVLGNSLLGVYDLVDNMLHLDWWLNRDNHFYSFLFVLTNSALAWVLFLLGTSKANLVLELQHKDVLGGIMQHEREAYKAVSASRSSTRYCRHCGAEVRSDAVACTSCGMDPRVGFQYCSECSTETKAGQVLCLKCGASLTGTSSDKSKVAAGVLAILLGSLGIHKFYLGYSTAGVITLLISIIGGFVLVGPVIMSIIGLIEGVIYLTKSDQEFTRTYVSNKKQWF